MSHKCRQVSPRLLLAVALSSVLLVVFTSSVPAAFGKDKDSDTQFSRVYRHTYDEVFQAAQETIERNGYFITDADKDKGTITGTFEDGKHTFVLQIESISTKPETRVTMTINWKQLMGGAITRRSVGNQYLSKLQQTLATYK